MLAVVWHHNNEACPYSMNNMFAKLVQLRSFLWVSSPSFVTTQGPISKNAPSMELAPGPLCQLVVSMRCLTGSGQDGVPVEPNYQWCILWLLATLKVPCLRSVKRTTAVSAIHVQKNMDLSLPSGTVPDHCDEPASQTLSFCLMTVADDRGGD